MAAPARSDASASTNGHTRRASTSNNQVSYAYGAPSTGSTHHHYAADGTGRANTAASVSRPASSRGGAASADEQQPPLETGRAEEPAAVRYARIQQRKKDIGQPFLPSNTATTAGSAASAAPPLPGTTVNIANAFNQAIMGQGEPQSGARQQRRSTREPSVANSARADDDEDDVPDGGKETQMSSHAPSSAKKRKRAAKDRTYKPTQEEEEEDEYTDGNDSEARGAAKKSRRETDENGKEKRRRSTQKKDATYRPDTESTADDDEDDENADARRRRRSKGKGRATSSAPKAIPIGRRDGEVWMSSKKRRRSRKSNGAAGEEEGSSELDEDDEHEEADESVETQVAAAEAAPKPAPQNRATYFLRARSSSPATPLAPGALIVDSSPRQRTPRRGGTPGRVASPAMSYEASYDVPLEDTSSFLAAAATSNGSIDDSLVRGSSYDYSEEERIVAILEAQRRGAPPTPSTSRAAPPTPSSSGGLRQRLGAGPRPQRILSDINEADETPRRGWLARVSRIVRPTYGAITTDRRKIVRVATASVALVLLVPVLLLALRHQAQSSVVYTPPAMRPASFDELTSRLAGLEETVGRLSDASARRLQNVELALDSDRRMLRRETTEMQGGLTRVRADMASIVDKEARRILAAEELASRADVRRELRRLKQDFEDKANDNFQKLGQEILLKVARENDAREQETRKLIDEVAAARPSAAPVQVAASDADAINALVEQALLRYSKDKLARPDYALYSGGGRVIPSLTSETYRARPDTLGQRVLAWATGSQPMPGRPPVTALHPDTSVGSCWPFAGRRGQLGVLLSRRIVPDEIVLEHITSDVALDGSVASAPRDFEVWGVLDDHDSVERLQRYREQSTHDEVASVPPSPNHVLLASGTFDAKAQDRTLMQRFPVSAATRELQLPVSIVILKVLDNHGDDHFTCLYRFRLHGTTA